jgi:hypothetical protein
MPAGHLRLKFPLRYKISFTSVLFICKIFPRWQQAFVMVGGHSLKKAVNSFVLSIKRKRLFTGAWKKTCF